MPLKDTIHDFVIQEGPRAGFAIESLLDQNPNLVNSFDELGKAPLHYAVETTTHVDLLLSSRADFNLPSRRENRTPFYLAVKCRNQKSVELIHHWSQIFRIPIDLTIKELEYDWVPLHVACENSDLWMTKFLIQTLKSEVNPVDAWGRTPYQLVVENRNDPVLCVWLALEGGTYFNKEISQPQPFKPFESVLIGAGSWESALHKVKKEGDDLQIFGRDGVSSYHTKLKLITDAINLQKKNEVLKKLLDKRIRGILRIKNCSLTAVVGVFEWLIHRSVSEKTKPTSLVKIWLLADALSLDELTNYCQKHLFQSIKSRIERKAAQSRVNAHSKRSTFMTQSVSGSVFFGAWKGFSLAQYLVALYLCFEDLEDAVRERAFRLEGIIASCIIGMLKECLEIYKEDPRKLVESLFESIERLTTPSGSQTGLDFDDDCFSFISVLEKKISSRSILNKIKLPVTNRFRPIFEVPDVRDLKNASRPLPKPVQKDFVPVIPSNETVTKPSAPSTQNTVAQKQTNLLKQRLEEKLTCNETQVKALQDKHPKPVRKLNLENFKMLDPRKLIQPGGGGAKPAARILLEEAVATSETVVEKEKEKENEAPKSRFATLNRPKIQKRKPPSKSSSSSSTQTQTVETEAQVEEALENLQQEQEHLLEQSLLVEIAQKLDLAVNSEDPDNLVLAPPEPEPTLPKPTAFVFLGHVIEGSSSSQADPEIDQLEETFKELGLLDVPVKVEEELETYLKLELQQDPTLPADEHKDFWSCKTCTYFNEPTFLECELCLTQKEISEQPVRQPQPLPPPVLSPPQPLPPNDQSAPRKENLTGLSQSPSLSNSVKKKSVCLFKQKCPFISDAEHTSKYHGFETPAYKYQDQLDFLLQAFPDQDPKLLAKLLDDSKGEVNQIADSLFNLREAF